MEFNTNYNSIDISYFQEDYIHSSVRMNNSNSTAKRFEFILNTTLDGFIGMDFYDPRMYAYGCKQNQTTADFRVFQDGELVSGGWWGYSDNNHYAFLRRNWTAGRYSVFIQVNWTSVDVKDYAFRIYFNQSFAIGVQEYATNDIAYASVYTPLNISAIMRSISFTTLNLTYVPVTIPVFPNISYPLVIARGASADLTICKNNLTSFPKYIGNSLNTSSGWKTMSNGKAGYFFRLWYSPKIYQVVITVTITAPRAYVSYDGYTSC